MKILITIHGNDVAPRFDLTTEVVIATVSEHQQPPKTRILLLPRPSAEELCSLILKEEVAAVICGGIEEGHYRYLLWKKVTVIDGVIGPYMSALQLALGGRLDSGAIINRSA